MLEAVGNLFKVTDAVVEVASNMGWLKVWDAALDHGPSGTIAVLTILKLLCKTVFADRKCNVPECDFVIPPKHSML